jgi:hypothetical protein
LAAAALLSVQSRAQTSVATTLSAAPVNLTTTVWFGPLAITPSDTARFNYTNLGTDTVRILWAFTNSLTGEVVCSNAGKPAMVMPGEGAVWDYSQTIEPSGEEIRHCEAGVGAEIEPDEKYFDGKHRHGLLAWILITHANAAALRRAVDLPNVELFDSMRMMDIDGRMMESPTFGRTFAVFDANPVAPTNYQIPKTMLATFGQ